jgi:hypothetical protein
MSFPIGSWVESDGVCFCRCSPRATSEAGPSPSFKSSPGAGRQPLTKLSECFSTLAYCTRPMHSTGTASQRSIDLPNRSGVFCRLSSPTLQGPSSVLRGDYRAGPKLSCQEFLLLATWLPHGTDADLVALVSQRAGGVAQTN